MADIIQMQQGQPESRSQRTILRTIKSREWVPERGNPDVGKKIFMMLSESIKDKINIGLHSKWNRDYELRMNKHWRNKNIANVKLTEANLLYTHIQRTVNTLTDNNPTFNLAVIGGNQEIDEDIFTGLQHAAEHWWLDQEQQDVLETSVLNGETYNIAIEKVIFNPDLEFGQGEAETLIIDPFNFGWYPVKLRSLKELQKHPVILHWEAIPVHDLRAKYPKYADQIRPMSDLIKELSDERREINSQSGDKGRTQSMFTSILTVVRELFETDGKTGEEAEEDLVCEAWVLDHTMVEAQYEDGRIVEEPLYPGFIRMIKVCQGGDLVLEDRENPNVNRTIDPNEARKTYLYDKRPFVAVNSVKDTSNAWGMSHDVEQLHKLNIELDKAISQLVYLKDKAARAKIVNPKNSGVQDHEFTNESGIIRPTTAEIGQGIRVLDFPALPIDINASITLFKELFMLIGGTFDLDIAQQNTKGALAYKSIAALIERASTMNRGKIRAYGRLIRERGRMYLSHVMNFYTEDRWIPYEDRLGQTQFTKVNGPKMIVPAKLTVVTGSTMPISKIQQREEATTLFQLGAIDKQEVLERLEWPNRAEVVKRMTLGPVGIAMEKLKAINMPPELVDFIGQIVMLDDKEFKKALEQGKLPDFMAILKKALLQQQGQEQPSPEEMEGQAKVEKLLAERDLIREQIVTERVKQQQVQAGIVFDEEQLKIERAKVVADMKKNVNDFEADMAKTTMAKNKPGYNEKGMKSNNKVT